MSDIAMPIGVAKANTGLDGISWNILGQTYVPMLSGRLDVLLDGQPGQAEPGDLVCLPRGVPHGLFNKSDAAVKCFFWVSPTRRLYDLFWALHNLGPTPAIPDVVALAAQHEVDFLPPA